MREGKIRGCIHVQFTERYYVPFKRYKRICNLALYTVEQGERNREKEKEREKLK